VRVRCEVRLAQARQGIQADIGFGDAVTPAAAAVAYPTLLSFPAPELLVYPRETIIAEKFQALVMLGIANSRTKDFYDLWVLARRFPFEGLVLCQALQATFERRRTAVPKELPLGLSTTFSTDKEKRRQWEAFLKKGKLHTEGLALEQVSTVLGDFLMPPAQAQAIGKSFDLIWPASGPWLPPPGSG
jgi:hypothetical protein